MGSSVLPDTDPLAAYRAEKADPLTAYRVQQQHARVADDAIEHTAPQDETSPLPISSADVRRSMTTAAPEPFTLGGSGIITPPKPMPSRLPGSSHPLPDVVPELVHAMTPAELQQVPIAPRRAAPLSPVPTVRPDATEPAAPTGTNLDILTKRVSADLAPMNAATDAEITKPTSALGKVADVAGTMIEHPVSTAVGVVKALPEAGFTLGKFVAQEQRKAQGAWIGDDGQPAADVVSKHDAAFAAGQLIASGATEAALPFVNQYLGASMAQKVDAALRAQPGATAAERATIATRAMMADYATRVAAHAVAGGAVGASFSPNDPTTGGILGALIGGAHAAAGGAHVTRAVESNLSDHPDRLLGSGRMNEPTATATMSEPPSGAPDITPTVPPPDIAPRDQSTPQPIAASTFQDRAAQTLFDKRYPPGTGNGSGTELSPEEAAALAKRESDYQAARGPNPTTASGDLVTPAPSPALQAIADATRLVGPGQWLSRVRAHVAQLGDTLTDDQHNAAIESVARSILAGHYGDDLSRSVLPAPEPATLTSHGLPGAPVSAVSPQADQNAGVASDVSRAPGVAPVQTGVSGQEAPAAQVSDAGVRARLAARPQLEGAVGHDSHIFLSDGGRVATQYAVVDAGQIDASHDPVTFTENPNYPTGVQGRAYHGTQGLAARHQVEIATGSMRPDVLLDRGAGVTDGPPVITPHGVVVMGNQRAMMLQRAASVAPQVYEKYRQSLAETAGQFGVNPDDVAGMQHPVLVRVINDPSVNVNDPNQLARLNRVSDQAPTKTKDQVSAAMSRATAMQGASDAMQHLSETMDPNSTVRDYLGSSPGREFVRKLVQDGVIAPQELPSFVDAGTNAVNAEGRQRIDDMLSAAAIGNADVMARAPADALRKIGPSVPALLSAHATGAYSLQEPLQGALDVLSSAAAMRDASGSGKRSVDDFLAQGDMFGRSIPPHVADLARLIEHSSPTELSKTFRAYATIANEAAQQSQSHDMFGHQPEAPGQLQSRILAPEPASHVSEDNRSPRERIRAQLEEGTKAFGSPAAMRTVAEKIRATGLPLASEREAQVANTRATNLDPAVDIRGMTVRAPEDVFRALYPYRDPGVERFHVLYLDDSDRVVGHEITSSGIINSTNVAHVPRTVRTRSAALGVKRVVLAHNHPSGDPTPSDDDRTSTARIVGRLSESGVTVVGHLVINHETATWMVDGQPDAPVRLGRPINAPYVTALQAGRDPVDAENVFALLSAATDPRATTVFHLDHRFRVVAVEPMAGDHRAIADLLGPRQRALAAQFAILAGPSEITQPIIAAIRQARPRVERDHPQGWTDAITDVLTITRGRHGRLTTESARRQSQIAGERDVPTRYAESSTRLLETGERPVRGAPGRIPPSSSAPLLGRDDRDGHLDAADRNVVGGPRPSGPSAEGAADGRPIAGHPPASGRLASDAGEDVGRRDAGTAGVRPGRSDALVGRASTGRLSEPDLFGAETAEERTARREQPVDYSKAISAEEMAHRSARGETRRAVESLTGEEPVATSRDDRQLSLMETGPEYGAKQHVDRFYSRLDRAIQSAPFEKGTAEQWKAHLSKNVASGEREWTGVDQLLDDNAGKVLTKAQVAKRFAENRIELKESVASAETARTVTSPLNWQQGNSRGHWRGLIAGKPEAAYSVEFMPSNGMYRLTGGVGSEAFPTLEAAKTQAQYYADNQTRKTVDRPKFQSYAEPGGSNYREIKIQLDRKQPIAENERPLIEKYKAKYGEGWPQQLSPEEQGEFWRARNERVPVGGEAKSGDFHSSHFDEPNILAHARVTDRTLPNGEKVLFVEELQSDWHQKGRAHGYKPVESEAQRKARTRLRAVNDELTRLRDQPASRVGSREQELWAEQQRLERDVQNDNGVPDAPFKKTEEWMGLAMKRLIDEAVKTGADRIAWTTGDQQAARYDLSKHVGSLYYEPESGRLTATSPNEMTSVHQGTYDPKALPSVIGKEAAKKLLEAPLVERPFRQGVDADAYDLPKHHVLTGDGLKVGGQGMRSFYDEMLPKWARDYAKKMGVKVDIENVPATGGGLVEQTRREMPWVVYDEREGEPNANNDNIRSRHATQRDAEKELDRLIGENAGHVNGLAVGKAPTPADMQGGNPSFRVAPFADKVNAEGQYLMEGESNYAPSSRRPIGSAAMPPKLPAEPQPVGSLFGDETPADDPLVSYRNAASARSRDVLGMDERERPEPRTQDAMYEAGKAKAEADPGAMDRLLQELRTDPEKIAGSKEEAGLLLKKRVDLENELKSLIDRKDAAVSEHDMPAEHLARLQLAEKRAEIKEFVHLAERTGTATARALAARKMMSALDYSLSHMEAMSEAAKGSPLTDQELSTIKRLHDELTEKLAAVEQDAKAAHERAAIAEADLHHAKLRLEVAGPLADRITAKLDKASTAAMARIRARGLRASAGMDPIDLADHAIIGAAELAKGAAQFADWSETMVTKLGASVKPHLEEIFAASNTKLDAELSGVQMPKQQPTRLKSAADIRSRLKARAFEGDSLPELREYLRRLALEHIRSGITGREPLLDALHADVQQAMPGISRKEVRDALSGYGDFKPLNKAADHTRLREIQAEAQKLAQLEALHRGQPPLASGFERQPPNDETRRLTQQVNAAKKAAGITDVDRDGRLKSALASAKTRVRNQIKDLQTEIDMGRRIVRGKSHVIGDAELTTLKAQLADLRKQETHVFGPSTLSDDQRLALATRLAKATADRWDERVQKARTGVFDVKQQPRQSTSPLIDALRAHAKAARAEYDELRGLDPAQHAVDNASANRTYRTRLAQREAEIQDRIAREDYGPRPVKAGMIPDRETLERKTQVEAAKAKYNELNHRWELAHRTPVEKGIDRWTAFVRFGALSWPTVLAKLTSVALSRVITTPITDLAALGVARALPRLAHGAPRYGTSSVGTALRAEAAAQTAMWVDGLKQSGQMLRNRRSRLELLHGKEKLPPAMTDYMGRLHAALKEPIKEAEYARSVSRRTEAAMLNGEDATNPIVQLRLSTEAYLDAERAVSMNHNVVTDVWNGALNRLTQKDKATGKANPLGTLLAAVARTEMPVVKAPVNVVLEASEIIAGLPIGGARAAWAYAHGIEDLEPIERDSILRMIAKGSVGLAIMALYFYKHEQVFGGFYQPGEKRKPSDIPAGAARVDGVTVPASLLHNPYFAAGQFAASIGRVFGSKLTKNAREKQGYGSALLAASVGLLSETPLLGSLVDEVRDLKDPQKRSDLIARRAASVAVPGIIQWIAAQDDHSTPRKPIGLLQHLEYELPTLRERVPTTKARERQAILQRRLAR